MIDMVLLWVRLLREHTTTTNVRNCYRSRYAAWEAIPGNASLNPDAQHTACPYLRSLQLVLRLFGGNHSLERHRTLFVVRAHLCRLLFDRLHKHIGPNEILQVLQQPNICLLYTSDAADE